MVIMQGSALQPFCRMGMDGEMIFQLKCLGAEKMDMLQTLPKNIMPGWEPKGLSDALTEILSWNNSLMEKSHSF